MNNNILEPTTTLLQAAPDEMQYWTWFFVTVGCGFNRGCRRIGIKSYIICGYFPGKSCLNSSSDDDNIDDPYEYNDINLIECLETDISEVDDSYNINEKQEEEEEEKIVDFLLNHDKKNDVGAVKTSFSISIYQLSVTLCGILLCFHSAIASVFLQLYLFHKRKQKF